MFCGLGRRRLVGGRGRYVNGRSREAKGLLWVVAGSSSRSQRPEGRKRTLLPASPFLPGYVEDDPAHSLLLAFIQAMSRAGVGWSFTEGSSIRTPATLNIKLMGPTGHDKGLPLAEVMQVRSTLGRLVLSRCVCGVAKNEVGKGLAS